VHRCVIVNLCHGPLAGIDGWLANASEINLLALLHDLELKDFEYAQHFIYGCTVIRRGGTRR
jgi:hypothetical protein